ncbi:MAG: LysR family transcriptional regulator [Alphaproteobacteria bacterium]|nr:MAG: LysR family transcriptional regulator [Alphaproteobacteria bacterium]
MDVWELNLRHLRAVAMTVRLGNLKAVAKRINLSQPAVTQSLHRIEEYFGVQLFERRPEGMHPTEFAIVLSPRIEMALKQIGSNRVTSTQARAFLSLSKTGSYVAASSDVGISQPSLHRNVADLQSALNVQLVEPRGRGIALTPKGVSTARKLRLARLQLEAGFSEISSLLNKETGHISIGAMPLSRARLLPSVLVEFNKRHPNIIVSVVEGSHGELLEPMRDGHLDLIIGAIRETPIGKDLVQTSLFMDQPIVLGRKDHPLTKSIIAKNKCRHSEIVKLANYPWYIPGKDTPINEVWRALFNKVPVEIPKTPVICGSVMMIRQLLLETNGLTLLSPDQVAVELEAGWLVQICAVPEWMQREIGITYRAGWHPTPAQSYIIELLKLHSNQ